MGELDSIREIYPQAFLVNTEATTSLPDSLSWHGGEAYGHSVLGDLLHGSSGWVDWNLLLDESGGHKYSHVPTQAGGPVIANLSTTPATLIYNPAYYYLGHFSRFIPRGSRRVLSAGGGRQGGFAELNGTLEHVAFITPRNQVAVVLMNRGENEVNVTIRDATLSQPERSLTDAFWTVVPAHGIQTAVYSLADELVV